MRKELLQFSVHIGVSQKRSSQQYIILVSVDLHIIRDHQLSHTASGGDRIIIYPSSDDDPTLISARGGDHDDTHDEINQKMSTSYYLFFTLMRSIWKGSLIRQSISWLKQQQSIDMVIIGDDRLVVIKLLAIDVNCECS